MNLNTAIGLLVVVILVVLLLALVGGHLMGKRGIQRPNVIATRLNDAEVRRLDAIRGPLSRSTMLRILLERATNPPERG